MSSRYKILEELGSGGAGAVYKAYDTQLDRYVALKRLLTKEQEEQQDSQSSGLRKEAAALATLQHPNIVTIFDLGSDDDGFFIVMELLQGDTLGDWIAASTLNLPDFYELATQTLEGVLSAHAQSILHRDLKPENMKVKRLPGGRLQVKLVDFGLARLSYGAKKQTEDQGGNILGSIFYMAPEQFLRRPLDGRTDLYSLGCLYYQALSGQRPFQAASVAEVMDLHLKHQVLLLHDVCPHLPEKICDWVMWLMACDANDRPANAQAALDSLRALAGEGAFNVAAPAPSDSASIPLFAAALPARSTSSHLPRRPTGATPARTSSGITSQSSAPTVLHQRPVFPSPQRTPATDPGDTMLQTRPGQAESGKKMLWIGIGVAALALGAGAFYFLRKPPAKSEQTVQQDKPAELTLPTQAKELLLAGHIIHWRGGENMEAWVEPGKPGKAANKNDLVASLHDLSPGAGDAILITYDRKKENCPKYLLEKPGGFITGIGILRFEFGQGMSHLMDQNKAEGKQYPFGPDSKEKGLTLMIVVKPNIKENKAVRIVRLRNQDNKGSLDIYAADNNEFRAVARVGDKSSEMKVGGRNTKQWNIITVVWNNRDGRMLLNVRSQDGGKGRKDGGAPKDCPVLNDLRISEFSPDKNKPVAGADRFSGDLAEVILWPMAMDWQPRSEQEQRLCKFFFEKPGDAYN